jgi:hypothetical protein
MFKFHEIGDSKIVVEDVSIFLASLKMSAVSSQLIKWPSAAGSENL